MTSPHRSARVLLPPRDAAPVDDHQLPEVLSANEPVRQYDDRHHRAATKIQASYRGHRVRNAGKGLRASQSKAALEASVNPDVETVLEAPAGSSNSDAIELQDESGRVASAHAAADLEVPASSEHAVVILEEAEGDSEHASSIATPDAAAEPAISRANLAEENHLRPERPMSARSRGSRAPSARASSARGSRTNLAADQGQRGSSARGSQLNLAASGSTRGSQASVAQSAADERSFISESDGEGSENGSAVQDGEDLVPPPAPPRREGSAREEGGSSEEAQGPIYLEPVIMRPPVYEEVMDEAPQSPPYQRVGESDGTSVNHFSPAPPSSAPPSRGSSARRRTLPRTLADEPGDNHPPASAAVDAGPSGERPSAVVRRQLSAVEIAHLQKSGRRIVTHGESK
jgi:hypothetical protein